MSSSQTKAFSGVCRNPEKVNTFEDGRGAARVAWILSEQTGDDIRPYSNCPCGMWHLYNHSKKLRKDRLRKERRETRSQRRIRRKKEFMAKVTRVDNGFGYYTDDNEMFTFLHEDGKIVVQAWGSLSYSDVPYLIKELQKMAGIENE